MPEPGREQKTGQRSREIVQILPATLLVKRNLDLQHEPRYPDRGLKRFASFPFTLEHQMDKPLQQNKSRLWMLVWQVLGLGLPKRETAACAGIENRTRSRFPTA